jgi:hypothetical protein
MAVCVISLVSFGCGGNAAPPPAANSTPAASTPASTPAASAPAPSTPAASATPAAAPAAAATPAATTSEFGVAECDDYMKKYEACVKKLAPGAQDAARQAIDQSRAAWKQVAATEQGKAALGGMCKAASDAAAPAMKAQGCTW